MRIADCVSVKASTKKLEGNEFWLLNLDMVEQQTGKIIGYNYVTEDKLNGSIVQFDTENVLYSKLRPNLNKVVVPNNDGYATSEMLPLRPDESIILKEYLAEFLRSDYFVTWAVSKTAGAKMPRLSTKELLNKEINVPSQEKQVYIVEQFRQISKLIDIKKQEAVLLDELVKSRYCEEMGVVA